MGKRKQNSRPLLARRGEMAQKGVQVVRDTIFCSLCLHLPTDPVTTSCGHSYCMKCIESCWDYMDKNMIYSCPQCTETFKQRPVLQKNIMLAAALEELKKIRLHAAPADHFCAEPEDVACDFCTGEVKALKSCLRCLASYCEEHLQPHYDVTALQKHELVHPSKKLQENICSHHDEVMKMFCQTDQHCICYLCSIDEHEGHMMVSAAAERAERQKELEVRRQTVQQKIQDRERDVMKLQREVEAFSGSADKAVEDSEKIFTESICLLQKRTSDMKQQVRSQQETEVNRAGELRKKLEQEIVELKGEDAQLKQLSDNRNHTQFLHNYLSLSAFSESTDSSRIKILPLPRFEDVTAAASELRDKLKDILREKWIPPPGMEVDVSPSHSRPEPKTREEFLEYSCQITLDPNTAHANLLLSEGNRKVRAMLTQESDSSHPDRFTDCLQVLSRESLTGRCYWEVEWKGSGVYAAVAYKNISRAGGLNGSAFGSNDKSWALRYSELNNIYELLYENVHTSISGPRSSRVGVYLDHSAGILSFYSISETMTLLHQVQTTFSQPLYAGLRPFHYGASCEICTLNREKPLKGQ